MRLPNRPRRFPHLAPRSRLYPPKRRWLLCLEILEAREVLSTAQPDYIILPSGNGATPFGSPGPTGYTPAQIRHAYGFDQITFANGTVTGTGAGTTIAIVDAFDDPNIANDLHQFDLQFGLPDPTFTKVNESGGTAMPAANGGWASEIALDVEWAHAIAPGANILLVEANDNSFSNLLTAVSYAANQPGVVAVSMSWGGGEFSGETGFDSTFQTPTGHSGVTFVASSGDSGAPDSYPSASPNVLSVGGTTLNLTGSNTISSESGWSGSGGGISAVELQPSYQNGVVTQTSTWRANPDVAYDADPNTGFPVYDSYNNGTAAPWSQFGGTSDASPQWAALIAIADQGRALAGETALDGPTQTLPMLYSLPAADFHDITSGMSFGSPIESAGPGYDLVTGRGTPVANKLVADLVGQASSGPGVTHFVVSAPTTTTAGAPFSITVTADDANGNPVTGYTGTVHFTSSDGQAVLPPNYTFTSADNGSHAFSVTLETAGSQSVSVADTSNSSIGGSATLTVNAAAASKLVFGQQPTNATVGVAISPSVTVRVLDAYGNLLSSDNTDVVTIAIGSNPGSGTLGGTTSATVSGGVATFGNLTISAAGNGYTLSASSGSLTGATSSNFNVNPTGGGGGTGSGNLIDGFETTETWNIVGGNVTASRTTQAAHDGTYGLDMANNSGWIYRSAPPDNVQAGDTLSVWLKFSGSANGRAYFGFGAGSMGTLSLVAAPNTGQLILQENDSMASLTLPP
jgi:subtilase family serine protease